MLPVRRALTLCVVLLLSGCIGADDGNSEPDAEVIAEQTETPDDAASAVREEAAQEQAEQDRVDAAQTALAETATDDDLPECRAILSSLYATAEQLRGYLSSLPSSDEPLASQLVSLRTLVEALTEGDTDPSIVDACAAFGAHLHALSLRSVDTARACQTWSDAFDRLDVIVRHASSSSDVVSADEEGADVTTSTVPSPATFASRQVLAVQSEIALHRAAAGCPT